MCVLLVLPIKFYRIVYRIVKQPTIGTAGHQLDTDLRPPGFRYCWSVRTEQSSGPCPKTWTPPKPLSGVC